MSMSTEIKGFKPPDEKWLKMKVAYFACLHAGLEIPDEIDDFFNGEEPDDSGVEVDLDSIVDEFRSEGCEGYQIDLSKLPKDVTIIRFYNSW